MCLPHACLFGCWFLDFCRVAASLPIIIFDFVRKNLHRKTERPRGCGLSAAAKFEAKEADLTIDDL